MNYINDKFEVPRDDKDELLGGDKNLIQASNKNKLSV